MTDHWRKQIVTRILLIIARMWIDDPKLQQELAYLETTIRNKPAD